MCSSFPAGRAAAECNNHYAYYTVTDFEGNPTAEPSKPDILA
jgi:hypothetical protein